jgi:predicted nucleic acid-binding protein
MIVYVESNFVLELAFLQEEHDSCEELLSLSESGDILLVLPAFSIGEPYETWVRRSKQRQGLHEQLSTTIRELSRSRPYQESSQDFQDLTNLLLSSVEQEKSQLDEILERILQTVDVIHINLSIIREAIKFQESRDLEPQDSIIYASIFEHLTTASRGLRCFITQDKDFASPDIENDLAKYDCLRLPNFANGLGYIRNQLKD